MFELLLSARRLGPVATETTFEVGAQLARSAATDVFLGWLNRPRGLRGGQVLKEAKEGNHHGGVVLAVRTELRLEIRAVLFAELIGAAQDTF